MLRIVLSLSIMAAILAYLFTQKEFEDYRTSLISAFSPLTLWLANNVRTVFPNSDPIRVFTAEELAKHDGGEGSMGLCLAILGRVYDVSAGEKHYGVGGGYAFFSGRDASKAYVTGDFTEAGLVDDVHDLSNQQVLDLIDWMKMYDTKYSFIGLLEGTYYDSKGQPTAALEEVETKIKKGENEKALDADDKARFPPCNSHWTQDSGTTVWCGSKSGGIERGWAGVPRRYHQLGKKTPRCACIRTTGPPSDDPDSTANRGDLDNARFRLYKGCDTLSDNCKVVKE